MGARIQCKVFVKDAGEKLWLYANEQKLVSIWPMIRPDTFWKGRGFWTIGVTAGLAGPADDGV